MSSPHSLTTFRVKTAGLKALLGKLKGPAVAAGSGLGTAVTMDALQHGRGSDGLQDWATNHWDVARGTNFGLNTILGALAPSVYRQLAKGGDKGLGPIAGTATYLTTAPMVKDLMLTATGAIPGAARSLDTQAQAAKDQASTASRIGNAGLSLGGLGIGVGGAALIKYILSKRPVDPNGGRLKITLPTKNPNDRETEVDMPLDDANISPNLMQNLHKDVRRRLRSEVRERSFKRDPATGKLVPIDQFKAPPKAAGFVWLEPAPTKEARILNLVKLAEVL